ncbi:Thaumatin-like protein [Acorus calamus]|uniref:Thaumatin-like protein n=1 Tax=Acorus calamus TaxID=4465 RepID=A0AAV9E3V6_ACOCL|nr:Thaumatin-like protein [Acorus calamus]
MPPQGPLSLLLLLTLLFTLTNAATFTIVNQCPYTLWAAAVPGGGKQLNPGQSWTINVAPGTAQARIWARTGCSFDGSGRGRCQTGDCGGVLSCAGYGAPPNTLAEYALNQFNNLDFFDISLVDGFNVPMDFSPTSGGCRGIRCAADINGQCPAELRAPGGCNNPCTVFKTDQYCCNSGSCGPTGTRGSSRRGVPMRIVIRRMIRLARSPAPVGRTIGLSSARREFFFYLLLLLICNKHGGSVILVIFAMLIQKIYEKS